MKRRLSYLYLAGLAGALGLAASCSATGGGSAFDFEEEEEDQGSPQNTGGAGGTGGGSTLSLSSGVGGDPGNGFCSSPADQDGDGDGFTGADGDCNDCDPNVNPGAIEVIVDMPPEGEMEIPEPADENCDNQIDNVDVTCDDAINMDDFDPMNGARALDLCQQATPNDKKWGVLKAGYVRADGSSAKPSLQVGILPSFGPNVNVQRGARMLGLSSGHARAANDPGACGNYSCPGYGDGFAPAGFPQDSPQCLGGDNINDDVALEVTLRAPTNAIGYSFNFNFYSFEYPEWVCTTFNDQFIALVDPAPMGSINGNISFDSQSNPVSVNIAFFQVCSGCALGTAELIGTGFDVWDDAGATSWLKTSAPITGGEEFKIRWTIWDTGDTAWDSTALIDNFQWVASGGTVVIGTEPIPDPK
ncbi:MAG TPA: choice-of-anchor L domain-containing protein [Polyangiaceae bacterium]|nr:choice-of-anchor L domain-containing protein [Polyangiaceae bacterium]